MPDRGGSGKTFAITEGCGKLLERGGGFPLPQKTVRHTTKWGSKYTTKGLHLKKKTQRWLRERVGTSHAMDAWVLPQPHFSLCHISACFAAGSRYDRVNGTAHMLEHLIFRGTRRFPTMQALSSAFEVLASDFNAVTTRHSTTYEIDCLPEVVPQVLALLAQALCEPRLVGIAAERDIVLEEILSDFDDSGRLINAEELAWGHLFEGMLALPVAGTPNSVAQLSKADVVDFYQRNYVAQNLRMVVTGHCDGAGVIAELSKAFGAIRDGDVSTCDRFAVTCSPVKRRELIVRRHDLGPQVDISFIAALGRLDEEKLAILELLVRLIDDGLSSRARRSLVSEQALVYDVEASLSETLEGSTFSMRLSCRKTRVERVIVELFRVLSGVVDNIPCGEEWDKIRRRVDVDQALFVDSPSSMAAWIHYCCLFGHSHDLSERAARFRQVKPQSLADLMDDILNQCRQRWAIVGLISHSKADKIAAKLSTLCAEEVTLTWLGDDE